MQFIESHYELPREPDVERAEKSTGTLRENKKKKKKKWQMYIIISQSLLLCLQITCIVWPIVQIPNVFNLQRYKFCWKAAKSVKDLRSKN